ncbi:tripartite tricarboxylate transporter TctB family protein [Thioclava pacifica]|nr:tripartite tricarboxylate transporter TctB family protein [Thioclava pacifica]
MNRLLGMAFLAMSILYGLAARDYKASFGDPLGPAAFPMIIAIPAALLSLAMVLRPDPDPQWERGAPMLKQGAALAILLGYVALLEPLGFPLSTMLGTALLARLVGTRWSYAAIAGISISLLLFFLFDRVLGLPLPAFPDFMS